MSVNRDMRTYELWKKEKGRAPSGAEKWDWIWKKDIEVAVYKGTGRIIVASARYDDITHTGLTTYKEMKAGKYQIRQGERIFEVKDFNSDGRLSVLLLKEVDTDV